MDRRAFLALPLPARAASSSLLNRLQSEIEKLEIVDTHEHFPSEAERLRKPIDFFTLVGHYTINDLVSAGLSQTDANLLRDESGSIAKKIAAFEPLWRYVRNTGYGQALAIAVREIYAVDEISGRTIPAINEAIQSRNKPGIYREILAKKSRIRAALNDAVVDPADSPLLVSVRRFDHFVAPTDIQLVEKVSNSSIGSLSDLKRALEQHIHRAASQERMVAIKCALAYQRDLHFENVSQSEAAAEFNTYLKRPNGRPGRKVVDHMVHWLFQLADEYNVPLQIHTGMLSSNGSDVERTRPTQLVNVFQHYPRVRFDLFHTGYPYQHEFAVLVKQFPNVYGDFCWTHIISPSAARQILREVLDAVPANKLFGFGGDYRYPELSYGHLVIARRNIAAVLAERIEDGTSTEEQAAGLAKWLLHDNAARVFLDGKS